MHNIGAKGPEWREGKRGGGGGGGGGADKHQHTDECTCIRILCTQKKISPSSGKVLNGFGGECDFQHKTTAIRTIKLTQTLVAITTLFLTSPVLQSMKIHLIFQIKYMYPLHLQSATHKQSCATPRTNVDTLLGENLETHRCTWCSRGLYVCYGLEVKCIHDKATMELQSPQKSKNIKVRVLHCSCSFPFACISPDEKA